MIFVTATDTDVGKTFFSKSLINHLLKSNTFKKEEIAYLKPIQCGKPTDFDEIKNETGVDVYCSFNLKYPSSPDYASELENIQISLKKVKADFENLKKKYKYIVVEGAGGVAVPLDHQNLVSDLIKTLGLETVVVIRPDLGTINHSLLTIEHLKAKDITIKGLYVSARSRDVSEGYNITSEEKTRQNNQALKTIIKFTKLRKLDFNDFKEEITTINN
jgi:dethiobiotin synthetase